MANALDVIVPIIVAFIIVAVSLYLFTIYCHRKQNLTQPKKKDSEMNSCRKYSLSCHKL